MKKLFEYSTNDLSLLYHKNNRKNKDGRVLKECFFNSMRAIFNILKCLKNTLRFKHFKQCYSKYLNRKLDVKKFFQDTLFYLLYDHQDDWECLIIFSKIVASLEGESLKVTELFTTERYVKCIQHVMTHFRNDLFNGFKESIDKNPISNRMSRKSSKIDYYLGMDILRKLIRPTCCCLVHNNPTMFQKHASWLTNFLLELIILGIHPNYKSDGKKDNPEKGRRMLIQLFAFFRNFTLCEYSTHRQTVNEFCRNERIQTILKHLFDERNEMYVGGESLGADEKCAILDYLNFIISDIIDPCIKRDFLQRHRKSFVLFLKTVFRRYVNSTKMKHKDGRDSGAINFDTSNTNPIFSEIKKGRLERRELSILRLLNSSCLAIVRTGGSIHNLGRFFIDDFFPEGEDDEGLFVRLLNVFEKSHYGMNNFRHNILALLSSMINITDGRRVYEYIQRRIKGGIEKLCDEYGDEENYALIKNMNYEPEPFIRVVSTGSSSKIMESTCCLAVREFEQSTNSPILSNVVEKVIGPNGRNFKLMLKKKFSVQLIALKRKDFELVNRPISLMVIKHPHSDGGRMGGITLCRYCKSLKAKKKCPRCKIAYYCDVKCQKSDWKNHKKVCSV